MTHNISNALKEIEEQAYLDFEKYPWPVEDWIEIDQVQIILNELSEHKPHTTRLKKLYLVQCAAILTHLISELPNE